MLITNQVLKSLNVGFQTTFQKALETATTSWQKVATLVPSSTSEETYGWLGNFPKMKEWMGERQIQNMSTYDYTIKNKSFEMTVSVKRTDIEDDKIGIYTPMVQTLGQEAAVYPEEIVFDLLKDGSKNRCYDKKPFFSTDHPAGKDGKSKASNKGTYQLTTDNYGLARAAMMSLKNDSEKSLKIVPNLLVVPPALEGVARQILFSEQINGTTNIYKGSAELLVVPELAGNDTTWYLLDTSRPLKPLIWQERKPVKFTALDADTDTNVFNKGEYLYGADARGNGGYGFWQMAYCSDGTATK